MHVMIIMIKNINKKINHLLALNVERRHEFLWNSFGYLDDEEDALFTIRYLCLGSFIALVLGTILQWLFFSLYNEKYHPFKDILVYSHQGIFWGRGNHFCL